MITLQVGALALLAAAVGEGIIEFLVSPLIGLFLPNTPSNIEKRTVIFNYCSAVLGVGIALNFSISLFAMLGAEGYLSSADNILTGILLGRGSNYVHDLLKRFIEGPDTA